MTREYAKELLPIIQAYAEGKTIQYKNSEGEWKDVAFEENLSFIDAPSKYRIKPEPTYRPFKNKEECWNEMMRHKLFGWITNKCQYLLIACVRQWNIECIPDTGSGVLYSRTLTFAETLEQGFTFADGTPFGIKEE